MRFIKKTSAVDEVFQVIQKHIVNGELPMGHRFPPQAVMAEQMGVSRSTIREAINRLTTLGFLAAKPGVGTMVVGDDSADLVSALGQHIFISSAEVPQFVEARLYLEKAAVRLAILKADDEELKRLEDLLPRQEETCRQGNPSLFSELDTQFHRAIIESSHNQMLMRFLGLIWDGLSQFISEVNRLQSAAENALHYHTLLVKHLIARDLVKVESTLVEHLQDVALNIERNIGKDIGLKAIFRQEIDYGLLEVAAKLAGS